MSLTEHAEFPDGCAVIFGGSGGLGSVAAELFIHRGCNVAITYFGRPQEAAKIVANVSSEGGQSLAIFCDVKQRKSVDAALEKAAARFGRIHTVIHTPGNKPDLGPFFETSPDAMRNQLEMDVVGLLNVMQGSVSVMRKEGGSITAIVSPGHERFVPHYGIGVIPKAGVNSMVRYFAGEEGQYGIRVNGVGPGVIDAGMGISLDEGPGRAILDGVIAATPLRRLGKAHEVAEVLYFLASKKSGYITGQSIMVDGGFSL